MWHKPCRTFNPWCLCIKTRCLLSMCYIPMCHYGDVIMTTIASQITSLTVVYSIVYSGANQRKHQSSASLAFCAGNSPGPVNSPHKGPVTRKMFPFDDVIMVHITLIYISKRRNLTYKRRIHTNITMSYHCTWMISSIRSSLGNR